MALVIQTTGLEEYAPGGTARIKVLNIGGPGAGKTRWASYFPDPIFADCERGLASVADRKVPFVTISSSQDMLDLLAFLKQECRLPAAERTYRTVVIDTLDAFQRKIKDEWMLKEQKQSFQGWEAWGYLNARMGMLLTRLLNLDMNVVVNVHYKDRVTKDDSTGKESHELMLQLQGETADTAFNDFDLVGWTGAYFEAVEGERVQKRGITFKPTPDKPFLKDRLHVTPKWLDITFDPSDYQNLFERIQAKIDTLSDSGVVGEVPTEAATPPPLVVAPGQVGTGAVSGASTAPALAYTSLDKITLGKMIRDRGITKTVEGAAIRANTLKAELIAALELHDEAGRMAAQAPVPSPAPTVPDPVPAPVAPVEPAAEPAAPVANPRRQQLHSVPEGVVDTETGELQEPARLSGDEHERRAAVGTVERQLGGQVLNEIEDPNPVVLQEGPPTPAPAEAPAPAANGETCEACGKPLTGEDKDFSKVSWIRFRKKLCQEDFRNFKKQ